jgi:cysteine desulfurase / selenocysteine lyase
VSDLPPSGDRSWGCLAIDWGLLRESEFPVTRRWAYFDHAATAPLPRRSGDVLRAWAAEQEDDGVVGWSGREARLEAIRDQAALLLSAHRDEIAFINSTTHGIGLIAEGFPWRPGDNVVTAQDEYPSNIYPWMNLESRGVSLRQVESREGRIWIDDLAAAMDDSTRVLAISHVEFATGFRNDLDGLVELCRRRGVALFVDAIQGLGPHTIDVRKTPLDFLAADGHKWLLGPEGAGILYVRRDWLERLRATGVGWHSVIGSYNSSENRFVLKPSAGRFEGGSFNMPGLLALGASLGLFLELGPEVVSQRILNRADALREVAVSAGWRLYGSSLPADQSAIVVLEKPGIDPVRAASELRRQGVVASCRRGRLRFSPHLYNDSNDLLMLSNALASLG